MGFKPSVVHHREAPSGRLVDRLGARSLHRPDVEGDGCREEDGEEHPDPPEVLERLEELVIVSRHLEAILHPQHSASPSAYDPRGTRTPTSSLDRRVP